MDGSRKTKRKKQDAMEKQVKKKIEREAFNGKKQKEEFVARTDRENRRQAED